MAIYKRCNHCHELYTGNKCPDCSKKLAAASQKRAVTANENKRVYNTYLWQKCRKNIRILYLDYDIWLLGIGQEYVCEKPYIHHIVERDENPALVYDMDNLITVSKESHEEIHKYYKIDKAYALKRIAQGKENFRRLFSDD